MAFSIIKLLILVFMAMTLVAAVTGSMIYFSHISPGRLLAKKWTISDALDMISELRYIVRSLNDSTMEIVVYNDPATRAGVIEVYVNGSLYLTAEYKYSENLLENITITYSNGTKANVTPITYEEVFLTSVEMGVDGSLKPAPGIGPIYLLQYISGPLLIDWESFFSPRQTSQAFLPVDVSISAATIEFKGEDVRGLRITIIPTSRTGVKWLTPDYTVDLINYKGLPLAVRARLDVATQNVNDYLEWEVVDIKMAGEGS